MRNTLFIFITACLLTSCASTPPTQQHDICAVFRQHPDWYDYARQAERTWGIPVQILMAFIMNESGYRSGAKPEREKFLFIPLWHKSSARGYAQAKDPVWDDYKKDRGGFFSSRGDMEDALDFIGWYNEKSHRILGISKWDSKDLYLAYHEGWGGYRSGSYKKNPEVVRTAARVAHTASEYGAQLRKCAKDFKCHKWYQVWPLCR